MAAICKCAWCIGDYNSFDEYEDVPPSYRYVGRLPPGIHQYLEYQSGSTTPIRRWKAPPGCQAAYQFGSAQPLGTNKLPTDADLRYKHWTSTRDCGCACDYCQYRWDAESKTFNSGSSIGLMMDRSDFQCLIARRAGAWRDDPFGDWKRLNYPFSPEDMNKPPLSSAIITGYNCTRCNEKNDYAAANQKDGTYVCFNCR